MSHKWQYAVDVFEFEAVILPCTGVGWREDSGSGLYSGGLTLDSIVRMIFNDIIHSPECPRLIILRYDRRFSKCNEIMIILLLTSYYSMKTR